MIDITYRHRFPAVPYLAFYRVGKDSHGNSQSIREILER